MPPAVVRDGLPLAPVPRAVVDAVRRMRDARDITEMLADPVQRGLCTVAQLSAELAECNRRGSATPRRVLTAVSTGIRSAAEHDAQRLWRRSGLPEPWWNAAVFDSRGTLLGVADAWFDEHGTKAVFIGRMVPVVRSLISIPAGVSGMPIVKFTLYTAAGSLVWNTALILAGYALGDNYELVDRYLGWVSTVVLAALAIAIVWFVVSRRKARRS
jgi:hypothetical protein